MISCFVLIFVLALLWPGISVTLTLTLMGARFTLTLTWPGLDLAGEHDVGFANQSGGSVTAYNR